MKFLRRCVPVFIFIVGLMSSFCSALAKEEPLPDDLLRLLPDDTLLVFYVRDVPGLLDKWRSSPMGHAYGDSRSGSFFSPLRGRLKALRALLVDEDGMNPRRLDGFFCGRWLLAGLPAPADSPSPVVWVLIFDHNNDQEVLERFKAAGIREGGRVQRNVLEAEGFTYERLRVSEAIAAGIPFADGAVASGDGSTGTVDTQDVRKSSVRVTDQYFSDRLAILALADGNPIRRVLARLARPGEGSSLASRTGHIRVTESLPPAGAIECYADTAALAEWFAAHPRPELAWLNLAALRLGEIQAAGVAIHFEDGQFKAEVSLYAPEPRQGIARLLFGNGEGLDRAKDDSEMLAESLVPADALAYSSGYYPLGEIWATGRELLLRAMPPLGLTLDSQVGAVEQATGMDVRTDLLDLLGPQLVRFARVSGAPGRQRVNTTFLIRLREPRRARVGLVTLLGALSQRFGAFYIEEDRAGDWPVISFYLGNPASAGGPGRKPMAMLCLADSWLVAGAYPGDIAEVLKRIKGGTNSSIADKPDFKAVIDRLPAERLATGYINLAVLQELSSSINAVGQDWLPFDLKALPKAGLAGASLGSAGYTSRITEDELHISAIILYP